MGTDDSRGDNFLLSSQVSVDVRRGNGEIKDAPLTEDTGLALLKHETKYLSTKSEE